MKIILIKKEKCKKYDSNAICKKLLGADIEYAESGKPIGNISISHTPHFWAVCLADAPVGFDMEERTRKAKAGAVKRLHPLEQQYLAGLSAESSEWNLEFLNLWTAKEARMKNTGEGLALGLSKFSVITEDLSYAGEVDGFVLQHFGNRDLVMAVCSTDGSKPEIETVKYSGISAKSAIDFAADQLAQKAYSSKNLEEKLLSRGYSSEETADAIAKLKELGYLNDADYAESFAENAKLAGKGKMYVAQKLRQQGIPEELIPPADPSSEYENALAAALKIYVKKDDSAEEHKMQAKVGRRLAALGFEPSVIYKVLGKLR